VVEDNWLSRVTGGQFELSEECLKSLLERLDALATKISLLIYAADPMVNIKPPGNDPYSERVARVMNDSGEAYLASLRSQAHSVNGLYRAMNTALDTYLGVEHGNTQIVRSTSSVLDEGL
jgi:hypothetical protein